MRSEPSGRTHSTADLIDPVADAIYRLVHNYRDPRTGHRGAPALAPKVGMVAGTLLNKANPDQEHQLTLTESIVLQLTAGDFGVLHAYAHVLGHAAYELPVVTVDDLELLDRYAEFHRRIGEQSGVIQRALSDGRVSPREVAEIRTCLHGVISAGLALVARIEALATAR